MLVAERHWLDRRVNIGARVIIRTRESHHHNETPAYRGKASDQKETKPRIGAGREDLSHPARPCDRPNLKPSPGNMVPGSGTIRTPWNSHDGRATSGRHVMAEASEHRPGYERSDVDPRLIAILAGGVAFLSRGGAFRPAGRSIRRRGTSPAEIPSTAAPPPRLQIDPRADLQALRIDGNCPALDLWMDRSRAWNSSPPGRARDGVDGAARAAGMAKAMTLVGRVSRIQHDADNTIVTPTDIADVASVDPVLAAG